MPTFEIRTEALRCAISLQQNGEAASSIVERAAVYEAFLSGKSSTPPAVSHQPQHDGSSVVHAEPVKEPAARFTAPVTPQPAAPAGKTATSDECNKAFAAHAQKGGGRSAKTARDAIVKVIPHFSSFKALTPEECAKAVEAMEAA